MLEDWSSDEDEGEGTTRWVQRTHGIFMICDVQMVPAQDYKFAQDYKILSLADFYDQTGLNWQGLYLSVSMQVT